MTDILPYVDVLFVDEREAHNLTDREDLAEAGAVLRAAGPVTVVVKQGSEGTQVLAPEGAIYQPAVSVAPLVDSIGADDAFDTAFILGLWRTGPWSVPPTSAPSPPASPPAAWADRPRCLRALRSRSTSPDDTAVG